MSARVVTIPVMFPIAGLPSLPAALNSPLLPSLTEMPRCVQVPPCNHCHYCLTNQHGPNYWDKPHAAPRRRRKRP